MINAQPKPKRERSESRLAWARRQVCICSDSTIQADITIASAWHACDGPIDAHHVIPKSVGGSDFGTLPLCRTAHSLFHAQGRERFEEYYGVNLDKLLAEHNARYNREHPQRPSKVRVKRHQLQVKCGFCAGVHRVRGGRFYCVKTRVYEEVA